jgi:hypothetical protein
MITANLPKLFDGGVSFCYSDFHRMHAAFQSDYFTDGIYYIYYLTSLIYYRRYIKFDVTLLALILKRCLSLFSPFGLPTSNQKIAANPLDTFLPLKKEMY